MSCSRPCCTENIKLACASCLKEGYCGVECEKKDRKIHKILCSSIKNGSKQQPFIETDMAISLLSAKAEELDREDEIKEIFERMLAIFIQREGVDCYMASVTNSKLSACHLNISDELPPGQARIEQLHKAVHTAKEAIRINTQINGPTHPETIGYESLLSDIMENLNSK
jgi:hypothetical protein